MELQNQNKEKIIHAFEELTLFLTVRYEKG